MKQLRLFQPADPAPARRMFLCNMLPHDARAAVRTRPKCSIGPPRNLGGVSCAGLVGVYREVSR